jgi:hypothetical protein
MEPRSSGLAKAASPADIATWTLHIKKYGVQDKRME